MACEQNCIRGRWAMGVALTLSAGAFALSMMNRLSRPASAQAADQTATPAVAPGSAVVNQDALEAMIRAAVKREWDDQASQWQARAQASRRSSMEQAMTSALQTLRSQLQLYRLQHNDDFPTMRRLSDWSALLKKTNIHGETGTGAEYYYGPYLETAPQNFITCKSTVAQAGMATANAGWSFDSKSGDFKAVLPSSMRFQIHMLGAGEIEYVPDDASGEKK